MSRSLLRSSLLTLLSLSLMLPLVGSNGEANAQSATPTKRSLPSRIREAIPRINDILQPRQNPQPTQQPSPTVQQPPQPIAVPPPTNEPPIPQVEVETDMADVARFRCEAIGGQYTVMYYPVSQPNQGYAWAVPSNMGEGWTPERRCFEISRRLESYRPDGLAELRTAVENGYNTLCATTEDVPQCRIVLTVPPGENPLLVRDRIFQNLVIADSGQSTQGVYTWVDEKNSRDAINGIFRPNSNRRPNSQGIPLRQFLDPSDGGTGSRLNPRYFPK